MLVLSAAVLVIVIDARDVGPWGWRASGVLAEMRRHGGFFGGDGARRGDHEKHESHEKGFGRTRTQRSGTRTQRSGTRFGVAAAGRRNNSDDRVL